MFLNRLQPLLPVAMRLANTSPALVRNKTAPKQADIQFGKYTFRHILLELAPSATLNPEQTRLLENFEAMAQAKDIALLPLFLQDMASREYKHVVNIVHKVKPHPEASVIITMRDRFHSPFPDYFLSLGTAPEDKQIGLQQKLITGIAATIRNPANEETRRNALEAMTDIFFYCLRSQGKSFQVPQKENQAKILREFWLKEARDLLTNPTVPLLSRRLFRNELIYGLRDINKMTKTQVKRYTRSTIQPLSQIPQGQYPTIDKPATLAQKLKEAVKSGNQAVLNEMITNGEMKTLVPEWERIGSSDNHQHIIQDYNLADHLLKVLAATQNSVYYRMLNPEEQFRVSTAAFFHDIRKKTGPTNFREAARICVDPHHPGRSAEMALELLPSLGYTPEQVDDIWRLIEHHQMLGNMARPDGDPTTPSAIQGYAEALGSTSVLKMLRALTEGDVRCVRFDVPGRTWYDPLMASRLYDFSQMVLEELIRREQSKRAFL